VTTEKRTPTKQKPDAEARRTLARPGRDLREQWPTHLTVEFGAAVPDGSPIAGYQPKRYTVYVDGTAIGTVRSGRESTHRPLTRGSRLRKDLGTPVIWRVSAHRGTWPALEFYPNLPYRSRVHATADLIAWCQEEPRNAP
jgi:hypothetical protein